MPWDRKISMCQILNWIVYHCHYLTKQLFRAITVQTVTDVVRYSISPATIIGNSSNRSCRWGSPSSASLILCVSINSSQLWALWILSLSFNKIWKVLQTVWHVFPLDFHIVNTQRNSTQLNSTQSNSKSNFVGLDTVATWNPPPHHPQTFQALLD